MKFLVLILVLAMLAANTSALSCRAGRGACMASCMAQNCATGYCPTGDKGVCV